MSEPLRLATALLHADDEAHTEANVAPSISVSTTFRAPAPQKLEFGPDPDEASPDRHIYSRYTTPTTTRVESVLKSLLGAHVVTYASGIAATSAALVHLNPTRLAIREGYHGVHVAIDLFKKIKPELDEKDQEWIKKQMPGGGPACFAIVVRCISLLPNGDCSQTRLQLEDENEARLLPHLLKLFTPATSLGGVESLIEQRYTTDRKADKKLLRISVGLEDVRDLKEDLRRGLNEVAEKVQARLDLD
ncbi:hypothetical protein BDV93DRAFT_571222 [Ceratobasidium sp. AG-I]|nr:hypothetical protein BDV93DRAFT_571222 [Ceratobasidium sp. AG-I]